MKKTSELADFNIHVKFKFSAFWAAIMTTSKVWKIQNKVIPL